MHNMIFMPKGEQIIQVQAIGLEPMYFRVDVVEVEQGEPMCDASAIAHLSPIEKEDISPLTTRDEEGNLWHLKLIGQDTAGHSIVVMMPVPVIQPVVNAAMVQPPDPFPDDA